MVVFSIVMLPFGVLISSCLWYTSNHHWGAQWFSSSLPLGTSECSATAVVLFFFVVFGCWRFRRRSENNVESLRWYVDHMEFQSIRSTMTWNISFLCLASFDAVSEATARCLSTSMKLISLSWIIEGVGRWVFFWENFQTATGLLVCFQFQGVTRTNTSLRRCSCVNMLQLTSSCPRDVSTLPTREGRQGRPQGAALCGAMGCRCLHYWWWQGNKAPTKLKKRT